MTNHTENPAREAELCRNAAERARRLAYTVGDDGDRENILRFAAEQDQRAAELEATMAQPRPGQVTFEQQQVQQQTEATPKGPSATKKPFMR